MDIKEFLIEMIKLIRPKSYNKLTRLIVVAGLLLISPPLLTSILHIFISTITQKNLISKYDILWGFLLVIIGLIYNILSRRINNPKTGEGGTIINQNTYNISYSSNNLKTTEENDYDETIKYIKINEKDYAYVKLYDTLIGIIYWDNKKNLGIFRYYPDFFKTKLEPSPLLMPVKIEESYYFPELTSNTYKGLPGMFSDSLPDSYGERLITSFFESKGVSFVNVNPVKKLLYMGKHGMGALEYSPYANGKIDKSVSVDITELIELSKEFQNNINQIFQSSNLHYETIQNLVKIGTSAGGAKPKFIIGYNSETHDICTGQGEIPAGYNHWILKISGEFWGGVEYAYYRMACEAGIKMSESFLLEENSRSHFMTRRFDRLNGNKKVHMLTLAAIAHFDDLHVRNYSYEQVFEVMNRLDLDKDDVIQMYKLMVFNVFARNYDDHTKNISFLMDEKGKWKLAPAYDIAFNYDSNSQWVCKHQMAINNKYENITKYDLVNIGVHQGIDKCEEIIEKVSSTVSNWRKFANEANVCDDLTNYIESKILTIDDITKEILL